MSLLQKALVFVVLFLYHWSATSAIPTHISKSINKTGGAKANPDLHENIKSHKEHTDRIKRQNERGGIYYIPVDYGISKLIKMMVETVKDALMGYEIGPRITKPLKSVLHANYVSD